jgi:hypothetical protein
MVLVFRRSSIGGKVMEPGGVNYRPNSSQNLQGSGTAQRKQSAAAMRAQYKSKGAQRGKIEFVKVQFEKIAERISQLIDRFKNWLKQPDAPMKDGAATLCKLGEIGNLE